MRPVLLVLTSTYPRWEGDPEPGFVHELCRRLTGRFDVHVLCPSAPGTSRKGLFDGVQVYRYRYAPSRFETLVQDGGIMANLRRSPWKFALVPLFLCAQLAATATLVRRLRPTVVHAHWIVAQGLIYAILDVFLRRRVPFVLTSHGGDLFALKGRVFGALKRFVLGRATAMTVVSKAAEMAIKKLGMARDRIVVAPMGVDLAERFVPDKEVERRPYELLFVGRLVEKKGVRFLLQALPRVAERYPEITLTVIGYGPDRAKLESLAVGLDVSSRIRFVGAVGQSALPEYYRRAALFVGPFVEAKDGDQEGLGLVTVEAIGCGCPVVVTALPAVLDVLDPANDDCFLAKSVDTDVLADKICSAISQPDRVRAHALECRDRLVGKFDWVVVAGRYAALLESASTNHAEERAANEHN